MLIKSRIVSVLKKLGISRGDTVLIHSDITPMIKYAGISWNKASDILKDSIFDVIGGQGTLVVPTFTPDFISKKKYLHEKSTSNCGFFSNYILFHLKSVRSFHPIHSFCAIGKNAQGLMKKVSKSSTGLNSVFDRLYKINSKILLFNYDSADDAGTTFVHYVEQKKKVPVN